MATMGGVPLNEPLPYAEYVYNDAPGWVIPGSYNVSLHFASFTMPFAGSAFATIEWSMWWTGRQQVVVYNAGSSGASRGSYFNLIDGALDRMDNVAYAEMSWDSLAAGQVVNVDLVWVSGGGASNVSSDQYAVHVRMLRA